MILENTKGVRSATDKEKLPVKGQVRYLEILYYEVSKVRSLCVNLKASIEYSSPSGHSCGERKLKYLYTSSCQSWVQVAPCVLACSWKRWQGLPLDQTLNRLLWVSFWTRTFFLACWAQFQQESCIIVSDYQEKPWGKELLVLAIGRWAIMYWIGKGKEIWAET